MHSGVCGLHHVAVRAVDFDLSLRFYTEGLGCRRLYGWGEGDQRVAFLRVGESGFIELFGESVRPREMSPSDLLMHFALHVENVESAFEAALSAGGKEYIRPKDVRLRGDYELRFRNALVQGPSGEIVELMQETDFNFDLT